MSFSIHNTISFLHNFMCWPSMTHKEIRILKRILLSFPANKKINIFEYGSGYSTIYISTFLRNKSREFHLHSVDNSRYWHKKISLKIKSNNVTLHLRSFTPFWKKSKWDWNTQPKNGVFSPKTIKENEYINLPKTLNTAFDLIIVDGRFRRRCLDVSMQCVEPYGIVFMHDAQKEHYHTGTKHYRFSRFIDSGKYFPFSRRVSDMWLGSHRNILVNKLARENY